MQGSNYTSVVEPTKVVKDKEQLHHVASAVFTLDGQAKFFEQLNTGG